MMSWDFLNMSWDFLNMSWDYTFLCSPIGVLPIIYSFVDLNWDQTIENSKKVETDFLKLTTFTTN